MSNDFSLFGKLNKYLEGGDSFNENIIIDEESIDLDSSVNSVASPKQPVATRNRKTRNKKIVNDDIVVVDNVENLSSIVPEKENLNDSARTRRTSLARKAKNTSNYTPKGRGRPKKKSLKKTANRSIIKVDSSDSDEAVIVNTSIGNVSLDTDNYEISVKVIWNGKLERFPLRKYQKFADLMKILGERENNQNLLLNINNKIIQPDDTPDSIGYEITDFIHARVINIDDLKIQPLNKTKDKDEIELKIQSEFAKKHFIVHLNKFKPMKSLIFQCSEEWKCDPSKIKLYFDGEIIDLNLLADDLELEGGEIIDCKVIK